MTPKELVQIDEEIQDKIALLRAELDSAYQQACLCPVPEKLRPAEAKDVFLGNVLWYPDWNERKWAIVEDVRHPDDNWKAYLFQGVRYGLRGAFVEVD